MENRLHPILDPHALARELSNKLLIDGTLRRLNDPAHAYARLQFDLLMN